MSIKTQTFHLVDDEGDAALMDLMLARFGEQTEKGMSIHAPPAILSLGRCLVQLLAQFDDEDRKRIWEAFATKSDEVHAQIVAEQHRGGSA